jgi:hypothetical protein
MQVVTSSGTVTRAVVVSAGGGATDVVRIRATRLLQTPSGRRTSGEVAISQTS